MPGDSNPELTTAVEKRVAAQLQATKSEALGAGTAILMPVVSVILNAEEFKMHPWALVVLCAVVAASAIAYQAIGTWGRTKGNR